MNSFDEVFQQVKQYCSEHEMISDVAMKTWIDAMTPVGIDGKDAVFQVQTELFSEKSTFPAKNIRLLPKRYCLFADVTALPCPFTAFPIQQYSLAVIRSTFHMRILFREREEAFTRQEFPFIPQKKR